jgi:excisionase family DNA binding protein
MLSNPNDVRALGINDACRLYGLGRTTLYALIGTGRLRSAKICGRRLIPVEALEGLLAEASSDKSAVRKVAPSNS